MKRGFGALRQAKEAMDKRRANMGSFVSDFMLRDGESAEVLFNGGADEPLIVDMHQLRLQGRQKGKPYFTKRPCANGHENHEGCVYCYAARKLKDKRVGNVSQVAVFNVLDTRKAVKIRNEELSKQYDKDIFDNILLSSDEGKKLYVKIKAGKSDGKLVLMGQKKWVISLTWAMTLDGIAQKLRKRCMNCGGKVTILGYKGPDKKTHSEIPDGANADEFETLSKCNKCSDPSPGSLGSCLIDVTRAGASTNTSYNFVPTYDFNLPEKFTKYDPVDLVSAMRPQSADKMSEMLGIDNPFDSYSNQRSAAKSYDGDDDGEEGAGGIEDEDSPFGDDDDELD